MTTLLRRSRGGGGALSSSGSEARGEGTHQRVHNTTINIGDCNGEGSDCDDN
jgi:hypothetical protein